MTDDDLASKPTNTPEEIVGLIGNFSNRYDLKKVQERQLKAIKEYAAKAMLNMAVKMIDCANAQIEGVKPKSHTGDDLTASMDYIDEQKLNAEESSFGEAWTEEELAKHFGEAPPVKKETKSLKDMTKEEILAFEAKQDNSNDIYKLSARVKNLARGGGASLTPMGDALCNTYTHVLKAFYTFAETLTNQDEKDRFIQLIRRHEDMPSNVIAAASAGVKPSKSKKKHENRGWSED